MSGTTIFPQEIIDRIVDVAAQEFKPAPTLKALSLASKRHLLQRSRSHLFSRLEIYDYSISEGFLSMLSEAPHLLKFVRKFVVSFGGGNDGSRSPDLLLRIADHFERLDTLNLGGPYGGTLWKDFHPSYQALISKLLNHPLRVLSVINFPEIPLELLKRQSNLQALSVHRTNVSGAHGENLTDVFAGLKEFRLMDDTEILSVFLPNWCPPSTPINLVQLFVRVDDLDRYGAVWSFIDAVGGCRTLQDISLILAADSIGSVSPPDMAALNRQYNNPNRSFPTFPSLLSLQIDVHVSAPANEANRILHELVPRFFAAILGKNPQPSLEIFGSRFVVRAGHELDPGAHTIYDGWRKFDEALSNPDLYPNLRAVRQSLGSDNATDLGNLKDALPKTSRRCLMDAGNWGRAYRDIMGSVEDKMSFPRAHFR